MVTSVEKINTQQLVHGPQLRGPCDQWKAEEFLKPWCEQVIRAGHGEHWGPQFSQYDWPWAAAPNVKSISNCLVGENKMSSSIPLEALTGL